MRMTSTRRDFLRIAGLAPLGYSLSKVIRPVYENPQTLYIGTYTNGDSEGIYRCRMNAESGALEIVATTGGIENPSFLALDPRGRFLYAASETGEFEGEPGGGVYAYSIDEGSGDLQELNATSSRGGAPCYVSVPPQGGHVLVANYSGGNVALLPIRSDGSLSEAADVVQHEGSGANEQRQQAPHAHCIVPDALGEHVVAADLGIDRVLVYRLEGDALTPADYAGVKPGAGPRHFTFHPSGRRAYVINELDSTITAFEYDRGTLEETQTIGTLPDDFDGDNYPADIHVSGDGRFLYGSNRGHDSIAVFSIDPESGDLSTVQHESVGGEWPRNFAIDPTGAFLLVANQNTNNVVVFSIDSESGRITPTGSDLEIPSPVCVRFSR